MWQKPEGAKQEEKVSAEFWKPTTRGEVLTGFLRSIPDGHFGRSLYFEPAVIYPKSGEVQGYWSLAVGINSWLTKLVHDDHVGRYLAIAYQGLKDTPEGKMRRFSVYVIPADQWESSTQRDAPGFLESLPDPTPVAPLEDDDDGEDIPF